MSRLPGGLGRIYRGETKFDFIGRRRYWFALSALVLAVSFGSMIVKGFTYGIEFAGGISIQAPIDEATVAGTDEAEISGMVRDALRPLGAGTAQIQVLGEGTDRSILVQTGEVGDPAAQQAIRRTVAETVGSGEGETDFQSVGRRWGAEITERALRALVIFLVVILAYLAWQFEWKMAVAAIVALFHDVAITAGFYSLVGFEVTPSTVIAILTILGYSLYDTVVVFDKVEEHTTMYSTTGRMTYQDSANVAMNSVFARSINTSLTTLIPVAALLFIGAGLAGAETLKDLALALFIGILVGTYSSVFVATPVLTVMKEREPRYRSVREKVLREAKRASAAPVMGESSGGDVSVAAEGAARAAPAPRPSGAAPRQAPRQRAGSKKARRRKKR